MEIHQTDTEANQKTSQGQNWNNLNNKNVLGYNPKYKIHIHELIMV